MAIVMDPSPNPSWCYYHICRTASSSTIALLKKRFGGRKSISGNARGIPIRFTTVRNPYDRAFSIWKWLSGPSPNKKSFAPHLGSFCDLFENFIRDKRTEARLFSFREPIAAHQDRWTQRYGAPWNHVVRFESIHEDIAALPFWDGPVDLPHLEPSHDADWRKVLGTEEIRLVNAWAKDDFDLLGYEMVKP